MFNPWEGRVRRTRGLLLCLEEGLEGLQARVNALARGDVRVVPDVAEKVKLRANDGGGGQLPSVSVVHMIPRDLPSARGPWTPWWRPSQRR